MTENKNKQLLAATFAAIILVVVGICILWLTKEVLNIEKIENDAVLLALLLVPVLVFLAISGKLKEMSIWGVSAAFVETKVEDIKGDITQISEYEPERSTYLGKLKQILHKQDESRFSLIYADVDGLRQHTRKIFIAERKHSTPSESRKSEKEIRKDVIKKLEFALADSFCEKEIKDAKNKNAKYDIFHLEEPDVVMIAREANLDQVISVAKRGQAIFRDYTKDDTANPNFEGHTATIAIVSRDEMKDAKPRGLDKIGIDRLTYGKKQGKGKIYAPTSI